MYLFETEKNHGNHQVFCAYHSPFAVLIDTVYTNEVWQSSVNCRKRATKVAQSGLKISISVLSSPRLSGEELTMFFREMVSNVNDSLSRELKASVNILEL